jgi:RimJ/RimL family protein N-acetyltransferase/catechol 2,3-dioxygenase-like lactoylglutathione lyase family enzyme
VTLVPLPKRTPLEGRHVLVRPVEPERDAEPLHQASHPDREGRSVWTYLWDGPYESAAALRKMLEFAERSEDPLFFALVRRADERPLGMASFMRMEPQHGVIEVGHIWMGFELQRTTAATEAIFLMMRHAFDDLGYRRLEWKCNARNEASRRAAERFGFTFEGVFRKHMIVKGEDRDTAWYSIVDDEWPAIREAFEAWLDPSNFDAAGAQRRPLSARRRLASISRAVPNIRSDQPAATRDFFVELLGLDVAMDLGWVATVVSPSNPTAQVNIIGGEDPAAPGISVEVDDVDAVHARAVELGLEIAYPLRDEEWGVRRFMLREPSGTTVNVVSHRRGM